MLAVSLVHRLVARIASAGFSSLDLRFFNSSNLLFFRLQLYGVANRESMTSSIKNVLVELYECYSALFNGGGGGGGGAEIPTFCDLESDDSSVFDLSIAFSETVENQENLMCRNEVERYLLELVERKRSNFDVLTWWSVSSAHYPISALIAKDVFAMPISTVASESAFSSVGRVLDTFRSSLTPKMVECLICTQNWLQAKYHRSQLEEEVMLAQNDDSSLENFQFIEDAETELEKFSKALSSMPTFDS
ncbi:hypothetical protein Ddye_015348 [Dipteronia dyeriana]|uniref:HAT C-terminal dimerisation domain-containing protein n=1 Tax=Dipteronia dyeriana TaxID=168575 RepID=A0AAD9U599_9ROSI|nr:hypothetical protein Ddye_015348 [Dipteronia dyeriana]